MNSRWTTHPILKNGQIVATKPNVAGDIEILKALGRYTLLTANDLAALTKRSYGAIIQRLNKLKRKPNQLIKVCDSQLEQPRMYQWSPQAFHLTNTGVGRLRELGFEANTPKPAIHFIHQLTQNQIAAAFEATLRDRLVHPHEVTDTPVLPVTFSFKGKDYNYNLTPDGGPFGISYHGGLYRFFAFEADCASEPLTSSNRDRQAIETKFAAYLSALEAGTYETWGIPGLLVLFTTTSQTRMESMIALLSSMNAPQQLKRCFGFQVFPSILAKQPDAGWVIKPWRGVAADLNLGEIHGTS